MKYACSIFLYLFFQSLCLQAFSQDEDYYIRSYTVENGLPNNQVRCITQDKAGFLWFSTWDGLCRFDGYEFRSYYHDPDDSLSLPNINLREVHIDRDNNVWALAEQILCRYDRSKDHFIRYNRKKIRKTQIILLQTLFMTILPIIMGIYGHWVTRDLKNLIMSAGDSYIILSLMMRVTF